MNTSKCQRCNGTGRLSADNIHGHPAEACPDCGGTGRVHDSTVYGGAKVHMVNTKECPRCHGTGNKEIGMGDYVNCPVCGGTGKIVDNTETIKIAMDNMGITIGGAPYGPNELTLDTLQATVDERAKHIDPDKLLGILFFAVELGGEAGEALNVVKKMERERLGIDGSRDTVDHLAQELADTIVTACNVARCAGIDLTEAIRTTFNASSEKWGLKIRL